MVFRELTKAELEQLTALLTKIRKVHESD
jgi:hypothetical protein